jgi:uncharacterized protein
MIIDVHTHAFPESVRTRREDFFSTEPAFKLLYASAKAKLAGAGQTLAMLAEHGIDRAVIFGFPWRNLDTARMHNDYILEAVAQAPDRLSAFCCLDTGHPGAAREVERCLDAGCAGVGELAFYESGIDADALDRLEEIMAICRQRGAPVMIHTNEPVGHLYAGKTPITLAQIYALVRRYPHNTLILAHWGGGIFFFKLLKKEVSQSLRKVYVDTAASPFLYDPRIYRYACDLIGADRILWGTDFPLLKPTRYFDEMRAAGLSAGERDQVCGCNARALLGV